MGCQCIKLKKNVYLGILVIHNNTVNRTSFLMGFVTCIAMVILFSIFCSELVCVSAHLCCSRFRNEHRADSGYCGPQSPQYTMNAINTGSGMEGVCSASFCSHGKAVHKHKTNAYVL